MWLSKSSAKEVSFEWKHFQRDIFRVTQLTATLIWCKTGLNVSGKTRKIRCTFLLPVFNVALFGLVIRGIRGIANQFYPRPLYKSSHLCVFRRTVQRYDHLVSFQRLNLWQSWFLFFAVPDKWKTIIKLRNVPIKSYGSVHTTRQELQQHVAATFCSDKSLRVYYNFVFWRLVAATKFCCRDKDFHKRSPANTKQFVAATYGCN